MAIADADASLTALTRFGLGPTSDQIRRIAPDPRDFVQAQIADARPPLIDEPLPGSRDRLVAFADYQARRRSPDPDDDVPNPARDIYREEVLARARNAVATEAPFLERLVMFWSNFFAVAADKGSPVRAIVGAFEREAIRPHVLGRFADMLTAVTEHPAMLAYLDNNRSIGPHSRRGSKAGTGLNENLARETLELHSLGVDGGYSQADVTALANILTGWRTGAATGTPTFGTFVFDKAAHEPGSFAVLGKRYPGDGAAQGNTALADFAADPATAAHVARRLAAHFVADDPPDHIVATIAAAFEQSRGDLARVSSALVASDAAWSAPPGKFLPPFDFLVAAHRLTGLAPSQGIFVRATVALGHPTWTPPSPEGWPDGDTDWAAPDALIERLDWAARIADASAGTADIAGLAEAALGARLQPATREAIARAPSRGEALALLLSSSEFQTR